MARSRRSVAVAADHRFSDEAMVRCDIRAMQRETTRRCLLHSIVCVRHRMNAVLKFSSRQTRMKRSAFRTPASQRSCSVEVLSTQSRHASNAAEALGREMRPTVHASI